MKKVIVGVLLHIYYTYFTCEIRMDFRHVKYVYLTTVLHVFHMYLMHILHVIYKKTMCMQKLTLCRLQKQRKNRQAWT